MDDLTVLLHELACGITAKAMALDLRQEVRERLPLRLFGQERREGAADDLMTLVPHDLQPMIAHADQPTFLIERLHHRRQGLVERETTRPARPRVRDSMARHLGISVWAIR